jgi:hypothetical protein
MSQLHPLAIDLAYRPESYFWAYDNNIKLASDIKGWDLFCCLDANFCEHGYVREEVQGFIVDASSSFYAEFGDLVTQKVDAWVDQRREEQGLNELNSDDEDDE